MFPITNQSKPKSPSQPQEAIPSFIRKTYDILEEAKYPQLIDWTPDGTALVIKKPAEFAQKVLPAYFKHSNLTSFVRQLNMYNFHKRRTLDIGHVYFHELFQRGKRHLLKEIKRKNADQALEKGTKTPETPTVPAPTEASLSSLAYENQCIKQLYNEALAKISLFEGQLKQLTLQNQSLWAQFRQLNQSKSVKEKKAELTQDQLPMTLGGNPMPLVSFSNVASLHPQGLQISKEYSSKVNLGIGSVNSILSSSKESGTSSEGSFNIPNSQGSEENLTVPASSTQIIQENPNPSSTQIYINPYITNISYLNNPFSAQLCNPTNGLSIARKETSLGQIFEAWNSEGPNAEILYFADQKSEATENKEKYAPSMFQEVSVLGKRQNEYETNGAEPSLKRNELFVFSRRRMTSTVTEENEGNTTDMDLMDFRF